MLLIGLVLGSLMIGRYPLPPGVALATLVGQIFPVEPSSNEATTVMLKVRLPRIFAAMTVGMALATSGAAFQGVFRNPMVSPDILGVATGAGFGAAIAILFGLSGLAIQAMAFAFGLVAVAITYGIGSRQGASGATILVMVLAGMIVGTLFSAGISLVKFVARSGEYLARRHLLADGQPRIGHRQGPRADCVPCSDRPFDADADAMAAQPALLRRR